MNSSRWLASTMAVFCLARIASAEEAVYPNKPIIDGIGSSAGSAVEFETRVISEAFVKRGWPALLADLRPGAMGGIGATAVYRAKPDGYTLLFSPASPMVFNPVTHKTLTYDPLKMTPVSLVGEQPLVLVTRGDFPGKTLEDLVAYAKANPGKTYYSSPGIGGGNHMSTLLLAKYTGMDVKHVPFQGAGPAVQALLRGEVDFAIISMSSLLTWYRDGKLKFLAIGSKQRSGDAPEVPTFRELGYPEEFVLTAWRVLVGPPEMPAPIAGTLNKMINTIYEDPDVRERFRKLGVEAGGGTPQDVGAMLKREAATWERVARENNIEKE